MEKAQGVEDAAADAWEGCCGSPLTEKYHQARLALGVSLHAGLRVFRFCFKGAVGPTVHVVSPTGKMKVEEAMTSSE